MDRVYALLCFLCVLAASAQSGLGKSVGSINIYNAAAGTLTRKMTAVLTNGIQNSDTFAIPFPQGTTVIREVQPNEKYIYCSFRLIVPSGKHEWSNPVLWSQSSWGFVNCMPNCFIIVDNRGFWQKSSQVGFLNYFWDWSWGNGMTSSDENWAIMEQH